MNSWNIGTIEGNEVEVEARASRRVRPRLPGAGGSRKLIFSYHFCDKMLNKDNSTTPKLNYISVSVLLTDIRGNLFMHLLKNYVPAPSDDYFLL